MSCGKLDEIANKKVNSIIQTLEYSLNQTTPENLIKQAFLSGKLAHKESSTEPSIKETVERGKFFEPVSGVPARKAAVYLDVHEDLRTDTTPKWSKKELVQQSQNNNKTLIANLSTAERIDEFNDNLDQTINKIKQTKPSREFTIEIYDVFSKKLVESLNNGQHITKKKLPTKSHELSKKSNKQADGFNELFYKALKSLKHEQTIDKPASFTQRIRSEKGSDWFSAIDKLQDENRARYKHAKPSTKNKLSNLKEKDILNHEILKKIESMRTNIEAIKKEHRQESWIRKLIEELGKPKNKQLCR